MPKMSAYTHYALKYKGTHRFLGLLSLTIAHSHHIAQLLRAFISSLFFLTNPHMWDKPSMLQAMYISHITLRK